ncbi:hypothetical protein EAX61_02795 [Dokdonia sinensis]|uniref:Uncharacterized protein n=2 Tax=Dokdonia sinensis TaxID=2479847 RepID=A0A3M0GFP9_9FLAO|nr:hypothetical protein EAX61_02795 [Dokdonia sinensis]
MCLSISGPSIIALLENGVNIEIVNDFEEESNNEIKIDTEEGDKYFENYSTPIVAQFKVTHNSNFFYQDKIYTYSPDVNFPPPRV